ncbi:unnamed protein product [Rotaria sp. Silwood1]|nr:unnamed protein product [Rotaria sp. Silwood1]
MDKVKERTGIYHEHQEGALCAQHALNNLLQTPLFSADNLADIARELDKEENSVLTHTLYESENMDDTGFFNIQVLQLALKMFDLELISFASQEDIARQARNNPQSIQAYICNLGLHWFTIRRFGRQYFNLNSIYYIPELIPDQKLTVHLNFIQENGYSVFIVYGSLPDCLADQQLAANPISLQEYRILTKDLQKMIIDDKTIEGSQTVRIPKDLFDEYQKNPNDPRIMKKILEYAPKHLIEDRIPQHVHCSNPQRNHSHRLLLISNMPTNISDEEVIKTCNCPRHRRARELLNKNSEKPIMNDPPFSNSKLPRQESRIITKYITEYIVEEPQPDNSNKSQQQRIGITRQTIITNRLSHRNNTLVDDHGAQRRAITNIGIGNEEDDILQDMIPDYLLDPSVMNSNGNNSYDVDRTEELNQRILEVAIAASLQSNNSTTKQIEQTPESMPITTMNASPTAAINAEKIPTVNSEQTPTINSSPVSATNSEEIQTVNSEQTPTIISSPTPTINSTPALVMNSERISTMTSSAEPTTNSERIITRYVVEKPNPDNSNKSQEQQIGVTRRMVIITQSSQRNNPLFDDHRVQRGPTTGIEFDNEENGIWEDVIPDSLLGSSIMNMDDNMPFDAGRIEKWNQQNLEAAIAASLRTNNSTTPQTEETSELIPLTTMNSLQPSSSMNSEQTPTISLEPITINNPTPSTILLQF